MSEEKFNVGELVEIVGVDDSVTSKEIIGHAGTVADVDDVGFGQVNYDVRCNTCRGTHYMHASELRRVTDVLLDAAGVARVKPFNPPVISSFTGKYRFLSNFHPCKIEFDGFVYDTLEHAYQAAKTVDIRERRQVREAETPGRAKKLGRRVTLRAGWDRIKNGVMAQLLWQKFSDPVLRKQLMDTHPAGLVEGNDWGDRYWGKCNGIGENWLGRLLEAIRSVWVLTDQI